MKSQSRRPIGVFDSGLGGLTVVKEISRLLPHENMVYVGDTARLPYGTKSQETVIRYSKQISRFLLKKNVKAIVVACNTASALAIRALHNLPVPVLGVIRPGARAAVFKSRKNRIGVLGTPATMESHAYKKAIKFLKKSTVVLEQPCPLFVPLVEEGWIDHSVTKSVAQNYLKPLLLKKIDTLVLGCTHYPLLKGILGEVAGKNIQLIDSAKETANDLQKLLERELLINPVSAKGKISFFVTDHPDSFSKMAHRFLGRNSSQAKRLYLD